MRKIYALVWVPIGITALAACQPPASQETISTRTEAINENDRKPCLEMANAYEQVGVKKQLTNAALLKGLVEHVMKQNLPKERWSLEEKKIRDLYNRADITEDSRATSTAAARCAAMLGNDPAYRHQITLLNQLNERLAQPSTYKSGASKPASAICATRLGLMKLATSIRRAPMPIRRATSATLSAVATTPASFCNPSRGDTSTISIASMAMWLHLASVGDDGALFLTEGRIWRSR